MPDTVYQWLPSGDVLSFEELSDLAERFGELGVSQVRLTGGEPLLRRGLPRLIAMLAEKPWIGDLALTTNGVLLGEMASTLKAAGLGRLTVSLDTLRRDRFQRLARMDALPRVLSGIEAARAAGFAGIKLDTVLTRGDNDDEIVDLVEFARQVGAEIRFIEYMRVGAATRWRPEAVISMSEILERLAAHLGPVHSVDEPSTAPATRFRLSDGLTFGIIASTTEPFCRACTRARVTADGVLFLCLHAERGTHLGRALRGGASPESIRKLIAANWASRSDRGAELQLEQTRACPLACCRGLTEDPHLEMHTRGG